MAGKRQLVLDTETTGLDFAAGHHVIEIGAVELIDRHFTGSNYHVYINPGPDVVIDSEAIAIHGITKDFLQNKPAFVEIYEDFLRYITGAELIIHNAPFDIGFLNHELKLLGRDVKDISAYATYIDTLAFARKKHPGKPNNLNALCKRYRVDISQRDLHGALLDARLLAEVYLRMTQGQMSLLENVTPVAESKTSSDTKFVRDLKNPLPIIFATEEEKLAHQAFLKKMQKNGGAVLWDVED